MVPKEENKDPPMAISLKTKNRKHDGHEAAEMILPNPIQIDVLREVASA